MMNTRQIKYIVLKLSLVLLFVAFTVQAQQNGGMDKILINGKQYYLHKVKKAEGLYRISVNYGVSQKELLEANPEVAFGLKEGQLLKIPVISGRNSTKQEIQSTSYIYHTVEPGQTVYFISRKYDVPLDIIYKNNPGSDQTLIEGTIIKIPKVINQSKDTIRTDTKNYSIHVVKPKETMYALSKQYNVSIAKIVENNPALRSGILEVGTSIRIPKEELEEMATADKQQVKLEDDLYIYHSIKIGETLFSIAQFYNASAGDVAGANPSVDANDLKPGYLIRVPKASIKASRQRIKEDDNLFTYHKVKRKETLFAISRAYNVDIAILEKVNAGKDLTHLRRGDKIKVPNRYWFKAIYEQKEVVPEHKATERDEMMTLAGCDCSSYDYYQTKPALKVALLLPFNVEATLKANIIEEEKDGEVIEKEREEKIVSKYSKVFVEFYQGALLALDSLKKQGVNVDMFVYDTSPDSNKVKTILANPEMPFMDLIIGPAYTSHLPFVSAFSKEHSIPVVFPFSNSNDELCSNPRLFQIMPVDTLLFDKMTDNILEASSGKRIVMISTEDKDSDFENKLSELIRNKVYWDSFKKGEVPDFVEYKFKQDDLASLEKMFAMDKGNIVLVPSVEEAQVNRIITTIKGAQEKTKADVTLWGMPEWLKYQTINPEDIHQLNGQMFSFYAVDYHDLHTEMLINKYRSWFRTEPMSLSPYFQNATVSSNFSRYSLWGFDITFYFLNALKEYGKNFEYCISQYNPYAVQSHFRFERISNWGGFYNQGLYILHFTPDYKMEVQQAK